MKRLLLTMLPALSAAGILDNVRPLLETLAPSAPTKQQAEPRVPVVVELFTSEGCSSCPAADETLRELVTAQSVPGVEVIALAQHVDYWNRLGWADKFSSPEFTARQHWYAMGFNQGSYTPQAVVNGRYEVVGSQRQALVGAIKRATQVPQATVTLAQTPSGSLRVQVRNLPAGTQPAQVKLAITEAGLSSQVGRGENAGRLLHHAPLVRAWRTLGYIGADGKFAATSPLDLDASWEAIKLRAVVLVQETASHYVIGASSLRLTSRAVSSR
jgi:hypothetical protein